MKRKQLTAFLSAGAMTLVTGAAMLAISGFSMLKQPVPSGGSSAGGPQSAALTTDPQVQQLQQAVSQYQVREQQYQQALDEAKARIQRDELQLQQDQQQFMQFQQFLALLQQRGIITFGEGREGGD